MNKLTDLEICKRIAEIEGLEHASDGIDVRYWREEGAPVQSYSPLTDDGLCFKLMVKYKVDFIPYHPSEYRTQITDNYIVNESPNRAICLAIIASKYEA